MKKNKLYTANRWNQPAFMPERNLFPDGGSTNPLGGLNPSQMSALEEFNLSANIGTPKIDWGNAAQRNMALGQTKALTSSFGSGNPLSLEVSNNLLSGVIGGAKSGGLGNMLKGAASGIGSAAIGTLGSTIGQIGGGLIGGGLESGAGSAISSIGSTVGGAISAVNPLIGGIVSVGSGLIGGLTNRMFGTKVDQAKLNAANEGTDKLRNFTSTATNFDDVKGPDAVTKVLDPYSGGWFSSGSAKRRNEELKRQRAEAKSWAERGVVNNIDNLVKSQMNNALANYSAFGGPIETGDMGAINYGFMSDYLTQKKRENDVKSKMSGIVPMPAFMPNSYAIGGDLQTNGGDFSTGMTHINAGLSHEENPNEGVQLGVDNEGTPNLVEEGETIYNDYVFSNRILADEATKQMFRLPKKKEITFADISKKLEKEIAETPNDPISKSGFEKQMQMLEEQQERQKQEMEAERAKAAFEALSPEEQTALMQQKAKQEAMAQQAAMQEVAAQQQPTPEELAIAQQQIQQADGSEAALGQEPENLTLLQQNVNALGGELVKAGDVESNRFDYGGKKGSRKAKRIARKYDEQWFKNMAKSLGISDKEMEQFVYSADDPDANLAAFNNIYRDNQYNKSKDIYRKGQRQSKRNELFGDRGLYSYSDDKSKIYKARTNDADRTGWINKDYTGAVDAEGKMIGFLSQEEYDKLKPEEKEAYKRINERAGDRMYDFNGRIIKDLYNSTEDELLNSFDTDYDKGFKWDDKDAQTLQYPVGMEHSATSAMRYIPAIGGAIGLANDIFSSPDYNRPQAIIDASRGLATPSQVQPHYIGNYLTYRPLDIWYEQNALNAQSRATDRQLMNTSGGNRGTAMAGLLANGYNSQLALGNLFRQAQEYNDALRQKVEDFNRGTNIFNANADMDAQKTNAMLRQQAGRLGLQGIMTGYGMMDDIDARRQASMNANLTNVLQSLGNIGEEAYDENRLRWLERTGTLKSKTLSANGGKLKKKKKGLTI